MGYAEARHAADGGFMITAEERLEWLRKGNNCKGCGKWMKGRSIDRQAIRFDLCVNCGGSEQLEDFK